MGTVFLLQSALIVLTALIHIYVFILESFLWTKPAGRKAFRTTEAEAKTSETLAYNQGFYNLFVAMGLLYGWWLGQPGLVLMNFLMLFVLGAGLVLFFSRPSMRKSSLYQIVPPLLYFVLRIVGNQVS